MNGRYPSGGALINKLKTHCKHGHAYDKENTVIMRHGARGCKTCRKANSIRALEKRLKRLKGGE